METTPPSDLMQSPPKIYDREVLREKQAVKADLAYNAAKQHRNEEIARRALELQIRFHPEHWGIA